MFAMTRMHTARAVGILAFVMGTSHTALAQGRPFAFTVPFPDASPLIVARYDAGYGERTFEPLSGDRVEQAAEVDLTVGRLMVLASSGVAINGPSPVRGLGQLEAMVDAIRVAGWHIAVSGGVRRGFDGSTALLSRLGVSHTTPIWSLAFNAMVGHTVASGDDDDHDSEDYYASLGATARITSVISVGVETVASDLEGLWQMHEAEGGETVFAGPLVSIGLPGHVVRLTLSGGPVVRTTGNGIPAYGTAPGVPGTPVPRMGYMLRSALSLGL
jgi:hypothetical protein